MGEPAIDIEELTADIEELTARITRVEEQSRHRETLLVRQQDRLKLYRDALVHQTTRNHVFSPNSCDACEKAKRLLG